MRVPTAPPLGWTAVIIGGGTTVSVWLVLPVPPGVRTDTVPDCALAGMMTVARVGELTVTPSTTPFKTTCVCPTTKFVPESVRGLFCPSELGEKPVTVGAGRMFSPIWDVLVPPCARTVSVPEVGLTNRTVSCVGELMTTELAVAPPSETCNDAPKDAVVVEKKFVPVITISWFSPTFCG